MKHRTAGLKGPRAQARADKQRFFLLTTPCIRGHVAPRYTCNGVCTECSGLPAPEHISPDTAAKQWHKVRPERSHANSNSRTGRLGVHWREDRKKFQATLRLGGRIKHIGYFDSADAAEQARIEARRTATSG